MLSPDELDQLASPKWRLYWREGVQDDFKARLIAHIREQAEALRVAIEIIVRAAESQSQFIKAVDAANQNAARYAKENERLTDELRKADQSLEATISERDAAEEAIGQMYFDVTGESPEWSNLFGYTEALNDVAIAWREQAEALAEARPLVEGALCNCFSTPHFDTCNYVRATEWLARHFVAAHPAPTNPRETR
jgi:DNA repair exonuclease SbcCD ATPase subunit